MDLLERYAEMCILNMILFGVVLALCSEILETMFASEDSAVPVKK